MEKKPTRRIVTGHDASGKAVVLMDGPSPHVRQRSAGGNVLTMLWVTDEMPVDMTGSKDRADTQIGVPPRLNGSIFRIVDFAPSTGIPQPVAVPRDDGSKRQIFRCPTCQVAVFSQYGRPEVRFVRGGTLDQPSGVTPDVHIFTGSKLPWITLPASTPAFEVYYDMKTLWPAASLERLESIMAPADSGA